jgi:Predicted carbamoyl transferase, NodU family
MQYFIGLATTLHDPAIAIVDPQGEVVFAEASERYLQNKRAINCEPDHFFRISELIKMYCKPDAEFVIARTWSSRYSRIPFWIAIANAFGLIKPDIITRYKLDRISRLLLLKEYQVYHLLLCFLSGQMKAGANLAAAIRNEFGKRKVSFINYNHHLTHAATACYTSPFSDGACMIVDGFGEEGTIAYCTYKDGTIRLIKRLKGKESLGALYMLITELCGFSSFKAEEWKVMGLASYGKFDKTIYDHLKSIIKVEGCELRYASQTHIRNTINKLEAYKRPSDFSPLVAADLAYTGQLVFSQIMDDLLNNFHALTHAENLILVGMCLELILRWHNT